MLNDPLAATLSKIGNAENIGKKECIITPTSNIIKIVLGILNEEGYIGIMEKLTAVKGGEGKVHLLGKINKCGVIKPRFSVKKKGFEKFEKRYLPSRDVGMLIVSTPHGVMNHFTAKEKSTGGRILAFIY